MASSSKHTDWILETIDHLRRRKARPDLERICHVVKKRFGLSAAETEAKLEKLVDAEIVIKVDYKGNTSYRNAAKWRKSMLGCAVLNSNTISIKILEAILELSKIYVSENSAKQEQENILRATNQFEGNIRKFAAETGVSLDNINGWLKTNCEGFENLKSPLTVILKREIDAGRVKRLTSCNYVITAAQLDEIGDSITPLKVNKKAENKSVASSGDGQAGSTGVSANEDSKSHDGDQAPSSEGEQRVVAAAAGKSADCSSVQQQQQPAKRGRPPKQKSQVSNQTTASAFVPAATVGATSHLKLKRVLRTGSLDLTGDGAGQKVPRRSETRKTTDETVCGFCNGTSQCNSMGEAESLLCCTDCATKAHPSCMDYSYLLAIRAQRGPWQCMDCKRCCVCQYSGDPDEMLFCDGCDKGYHMNCHKPSIGTQPVGTWECSECRLENLTLQRNEFLSRHQGNHQKTAHESAPPTPAESPVPANMTTNGDLVIPTKPCYIGDGKYPDASKWSVEDVVEYLVSAGFKDESRLFHEQEIDGVALLLLKRNDVLEGLNLKLGPALKLNRHIQGLQTVCQNFRL